MYHSCWPIFYILQYVIILIRTHTYVPTYIHACIHAYTHTYLPNYIPIHLIAYIPSYVHTYIHIYIERKRVRDQLRVESCVVIPLFNITAVWTTRTCVNIWKPVCIYIYTLYIQVCTLLPLVQFVSCWVRFLATAPCEQALQAVTYRVPLLSRPSFEQCAKTCRSILGCLT